MLQTGWRLPPLPMDFLPPRSAGGASSSLGNGTVAGSGAISSTFSYDNPYDQKPHTARPPTGGGRNLSSSQAPRKLHTARGRMQASREKRPVEKRSLETAGGSTDQQNFRYHPEALATFQRLQRLLVTIGDSVTVVDAVTRVGDVACQLTLCTRVRMFLVNAVKGRDINLILVRPGEPEVALPPRGVAGYVALSEEPYICGGHGDDHFEPLVDQDSDLVTRSLLCVPVVNTKLELVAVVEAINKRAADGSGVAQFNQEDVVLLELVARQAAVALDTCQRLEIANRSEQKSRQLVEAVVSIGSATGMGGVAVRASACARDLMGAEAAECAVRESPGATELLLWTDACKGGRGRTVAVKGVRAHVLRDNLPINIDDPEHDPRLSVAARHGLRTLLAVPITIKGGRPVGVLQVKNKRHGLPFDSADELVLNTLSRMVWVALTKVAAQGAVNDDTTARMAPGASLLQCLEDLERRVVDSSPAAHCMVFIADTGASGVLYRPRSQGEGGGYARTALSTFPVGEAVRTKSVVQYASDTADTVQEQQVQTLANLCPAVRTVACLLVVPLVEAGVVVGAACLFNRKEVDVTGEKHGTLGAFGPMEVHAARTVCSRVAPALLAAVRSDEVRTWESTAVRVGANAASWVTQTDATELMHSVEAQACEALGAQKCVMLLHTPMSSVNAPKGAVSSSVTPRGPSPVSVGPGWARALAQLDDVNLNEQGTILEEPTPTASPLNSTHGRSDRLSDGDSSDDDDNSDNEHDNDHDTDHASVNATFRPPSSTTTGATFGHPGMPEVAYGLFAAPGSGWAKAERGLSCSAGVVGAAFGLVQGQAVVVADVQQLAREQHGRFDPKASAPPGVILRNMVAVPLCAPRGNLGVLVAYNLSSGTDQPTAQHVKLLALLGASAGAAVAALMEKREQEEDHRTERDDLFQAQKMLSTVTHLARVIHPTALIKEVVSKAVEVTRADVCNMFEVTEEGLLRPIPTMSSAVGFEHPVKVGGIVGMAATRGEGLLLNGVVDDPRLHPEIDAVPIGQQLHNVLTLPVKEGLTREGRVLLVLQLLHTSPESQFSDAQRWLVQALADILGITTSTHRALSVPESIPTSMLQKCKAAGAYDPSGRTLPIRALAMDLALLTEATAVFVYHCEDAPGSENIICAEPLLRVRKPTGRLEDTGALSAASTQPFIPTHGPPISGKSCRGLVGQCCQRQLLQNLVNACDQVAYDAEADDPLRLGTKTMLLAPVVNGKGQTTGVVQLFNKARGRFDFGDEQALRTFAATLCVLSLQSKLARADRRLSTVGHVSAILFEAAPKGARAVYNEALKQATQVFGCPSALFLLKEGDINKWRVLYVDGEFVEARRSGLASAVVHSGDGLVHTLLPDNGSGSNNDADDLAVCIALSAALEEAEAKAKLAPTASSAAPEEAATNPESGVKPAEFIQMDPSLNFDEPSSPKQGSRGNSVSFSPPASLLTPSKSPLLAGLTTPGGTAFLPKPTPPPLALPAARAAAEAKKAHDTGFMKAMSVLTAPMYTPPSKVARGAIQLTRCLDDKALPFTHDDLVVLSELVECIVSALSLAEALETSRSITPAITPAPPPLGALKAKNRSPVLVPAAPRRGDTREFVPESENKFSRSMPKLMRVGSVPVGIGQDRDTFKLGMR